MTPRRCVAASLPNFGDLIVRQLDRTIERINFTAVRRGIFEYADDDAALVLTGDGCVPACRERCVHDALADHRG